MKKQLCSIVHEAYARQKREVFVKKARAVFHLVTSQRSMAVLSGARLSGEAARKISCSRPNLLAVSLSSPAFII